MKRNLVDMERTFKALAHRKRPATLALLFEMEEARVKRDCGWAEDSPCHRLKEFGHSSLGRFAQVQSEGQPDHF